MTNKEQQVEMHKHRLKNCLKEIVGDERVKSFLPKDFQKNKSDKLPEEKIISVLRFVDHNIGETIEPLLLKIIDHSNGVIGLEDEIKVNPTYSDKTYFSDYLLDNSPNSQILGVAVKAAWDILQSKSEVDSKLCSVFLNAKTLNIFNTVNSEGKLIFDLQTIRHRILDVFQSLCFLINEREKNSRALGSKRIIAGIDSTLKQSIKAINHLIIQNEKLKEAVSGVGNYRVLVAIYFKEKFNKNITANQVPLLKGGEREDAIKYLRSIMPNSAKKEDRVKEVIKKSTESKNRDDNYRPKINKNYIE